MSETVNILGQDYIVKYENTRTDEALKNADGECRWYKKEIIIDDELEPKEHKEYVIRHEILHAFLAESGLRRYREDEDIINWIAWNFKKIQKVFDELLKNKEECTEQTQQEKTKRSECPYSGIDCAWCMEDCE